MECGAKKRDTTPCKARAMPNGRCRIHGGKSLAGIASPTYKDGSRSKYLPTRMIARAQEAMDDPLILEMRGDLALLEARLADLLTRVDTGESGRLWSSLQAAALDLRASAGDTKRQGECLNLMLDLISQGHADYRAWAEVGAVLEQRRRVVESEQKRLQQAQQMISAEQAMLLIGGILGVLREKVKDRMVLSDVQRGIELLMSRNEEAR